MPTYTHIVIIRVFYCLLANVLWAEFIRALGTPSGAHVRCVGACGIFGAMRILWINFQLPDSIVHYCSLLHINHNLKIVFIAWISPSSAAPAYVQCMREAVLVHVIRARVLCPCSSQWFFPWIMYRDWLSHRICMRSCRYMHGNYPNENHSIIMSLFLFRPPIRASSPPQMLETNSSIHAKPFRFINNNGRDEP